MSTNRALETALQFAGEAGDINSLKSLARQESHRADQLMQLLVAVLAETGPQRIADQALRSNTRNSGGFSLSQDGDHWIVQATQ